MTSECKGEIEWRAGFMFALNIHMDMMTFFVHSLCIYISMCVSALQ